MRKAWFIEANSSVGGLIELLKDCDPTIKVEIYETVDNPMYWVLEVETKRNLMAAVEDIVAPYM